MAKMIESFDQAPFLVIWEATRACGLACVHCRAEAILKRDPHELTTDEVKTMVDQIASMGKPLFVVTGGDPLMRVDLREVIRYAVAAGLRVAVTPSATSLLDADAIGELQTDGIARIALSLDGPDAAIHDRFRGVAGTFDRTLLAAGEARRLELPLQINTTITPHNIDLIEAMAALVADLGAVLWSVFFLVPIGRGKNLGCLDASQFEAVFARLGAVATTAPFDVKTTEAPHYRRWLAQHGMLAKPSSVADRGEGLRVRGGLGDGRGFVFVSHTGDVFPSGFLPVPAGNLRSATLPDLYRNHPLFLGLRDPSGFTGKCGRCEFRFLCGGSRARAWAVTGDWRGSDPACVYIPGAAPAMAAV